MTSSIEIWYNQYSKYTEAIRLLDDLNILRYETSISRDSEGDKALCLRIMPFIDEPFRDIQFPNYIDTSLEKPALFIYDITFEEANECIRKLSVPPLNLQVELKVTPWSSTDGCTYIKYGVVVSSVDLEGTDWGVDNE